MIKHIFCILALAAPAFVIADTKVVLPDEALFAENAEKFLITTTIPGDFKTPEGITLALLTQAEQAANKRLHSPFTPKTLKYTSGGKGASPLASYFRGARMEKKTIILSFNGEAMRYLNTTMAIQQIVKGSLEETLLLHFPKVKEIHYEIDGEIISEWDA